MKTQRYLSVLAAALLALGAVSANAAAGGNGGGGGGGGAGAGGGHGAGGMSGMGGMSAGHMSGEAMSSSNSMHAGDRDKGLARATDRSDSIADRAGAQPGHGHGHSHGHTAHASTSTHHAHRNALGHSL